MKRISKPLYWTPRIISILFILFLSLFSLDVISPEHSFWEIVIGLLVHNIPAFILAIVLAISWRYEIVGGLVFMLAGILYILSLFLNPVFEWYMISWSIMIAGPAFLIGILFMMNWIWRKDNSRKEKRSGRQVKPRS